MQFTAFFRLLGPVAGLALAFSSCNLSPESWQEEDTAQVDSLLLELDTLEQTYEASHSEENKESLERMEFLHERLGEGYADSADKAFWTGPMNDLFVMLESYEKFMEEAGERKKELAYTRKQLQDLKRSILDKKVTEMESERYLKRETRAVKALDRWMRRRATPLQDARRRWDTTQVRYENLLEALPEDSSAET
jgi:hypothetical protein